MFGINFVSMFATKKATFDDCKIAKFDDEIILYDAPVNDGVLVVPFGTTQISNWAFENCLNIKKVIIPKTVHTIGDNAFYGCQNLKKIIMPKGIVIGDDAFYDTEIK